MKIKTFAFILIVELMLSSCTATEKVNYEGIISSDYSEYSRPSIKDVEAIINNQNYLVGFSWVDSPINSIVLIKSSNNVYCAVKFTKVKRLNDETEASTFNSGAETFLANFDILELSKSGIKRESNNVELVDSASIGIGRLAFSVNNKTVRCGNSKLYWSYPTALSISDEDTATKLAPARALDLDKVNFFADGLNWVGYDDMRKHYKVPTIKGY
ncbi:hypothetical protein I6F50_09145 [Pseudoalteromonas sp. NZS127_1]|uniref:hypothetical protein n=1 Tax=unclassified Pseudoalteromonas TaxID=194690 RepID=UPI0018CF39DE|nr:MULTISPECIES: hypothetical protein [unclassified Pseudoalteromonas]MBG9990972.1 hypothetical protein [Pseudoalteromonas sp. NZS37]MBG9995223.1 hypothetical protein [Pseudoalteromonas sp. NZS127_1]